MEARSAQVQTEHIVESVGGRVSPAYDDSDGKLTYTQ